ncbi:AlpA family transcriptional regulator [Chitinimonas viridis]|uniref:AlpA family transcriptional regulator n=1 Tax=Chitinimonas viridis TaxID=664880 RepID=A0ABT8B523_9NEIS|nr:AlpA family transcriptional regulator [Chitinimonas viridis]MDN3577337.1 AlpA family transcriptional regulator [Chitinimonas viridis]
MAEPAKPRPLIRLPELMQRTGLSRSAIYDRLDEKSPRHDPSFPKQFSLGGSAVAWYEEEVSAWISQCADASRAVGQATRQASKKTRRNNIGKQADTVRAVASSANSTAQLGDLILDGVQQSRQLASYLKLPEWTPAMGVLLVSGIKASLGCETIPEGGVGLDNKPLHVNSPRFREARSLWMDWEEYWEDKEEQAPKQVMPLDFLSWCRFCDVSGDWPSVFYDLAGISNAEEQATKAARVGMLLAPEPLMLSKKEKGRAGD